MFAEHTASAILALATVDRSATEREKEALQAVLLGKVPHKCAIVRYADAAKRLGLTIPTIKRLAKSGKLKRAFATGTKKAVGVTEDSVNALAS